MKHDETGVKLPFGQTWSDCLKEIRLLQMAAQLGLGPTAEPPQNHAKPHIYCAEKRFVIS